MHAVLHLQTNGPYPEDHQPLKERLRQTCFSCFLTHHHRTQLAVITHQNQLQKKYADNHGVEKGDLLLDSITV